MLQLVHHQLLALLRQRGRLRTRVVLIDSTRVSAFGAGDRSGPSPVDRRKPSTKRALLTNLRVTLLVLRSAPANSSDHHDVLTTVFVYPSIGGLAVVTGVREQLLWCPNDRPCQMTHRLATRSNSRIVSALSASESGSPAIISSDSAKRS